MREGPDLAQRHRERHRSGAAEHRRAIRDRAARPGRRLPSLLHLALDDDPRDAVAERVRGQTCRRRMHRAGSRSAAPASAAAARLSPTARTHGSRLVLAPQLLGGPRVSPASSTRTTSAVALSPPPRSSASSTSCCAARAGLGSLVRTSPTSGSCDVLADAIAAQQEAIAIRERHDERRDLALVADAERVRQHARNREPSPVRSTSMPAASRRAAACGPRSAASRCRRGRCTRANRRSARTRARCRRSSRRERRPHALLAAVR